MQTFNFDASQVEQMLKTLAQAQQRRIERILAEVLPFYRDEELRENEELNQLADERLNDGQKTIRVAWNEL